MGMKVDVVPVGRTTKPLDVFPMVCNQPKDPNSPPGTTDKKSADTLFHEGSLGIRSVFKVSADWGLLSLGTRCNWQPLEVSIAWPSEKRDKRVFGNGNALEELLQVKC